MQMKKHGLLLRIWGTTCFTCFLGALLWFWGLTPYIEDWYCSLCQPYELESLLFQIYPLDWCTVVTTAACALVLFQGESLSRIRLAEMILMSVMSLAGTFICILGGTLLIRLLSVPAYGWSPPEARALTVGFNVVVVLAATAALVWQSGLATVVRKVLRKRWKEEAR